MAAKPKPAPGPRMVEIGPMQVLAYLRRIPGQWRSATQLCEHFKLKPDAINRGRMACDGARLWDREKIEARIPKGGGPFEWRVAPLPPEPELTR